MDEIIYIIRRKRLFHDTILYFVRARYRASLFIITTKVERYSFDVRPWHRTDDSAPCNFSFEN